MASMGIQTQWPLCYCCNIFSMQTEVMCYRRGYWPWKRSKSLNQNPLALTGFEPKDLFVTGAMISVLTVIWYFRGHWMRGKSPDRNLWLQQDSNPKTSLLPLQSFSYQLKWHVIQGGRVLHTNYYFIRSRVTWYYHTCPVSCQFL